MTVAAKGPLSGRSVLVIEDDTLVGTFVEEALRDVGCPHVWRVSRVEDALALLRQRRPDVAVLDVNLQGTLAYPAAIKLDEMRIPIVFLTGYQRERLPAFWRDRPVIEKPFLVEALTDALTKVLHAHPA